MTASLLSPAHHRRPALQAVGRQGDLANLTPFGRTLRSVCRDLLGDFVERHGHGFMDGGCAILARALVVWSGGRLGTGAYALASDPTRVQHAVAVDRDVPGTLVLDADGLGTGDDAVRRLERLEGVRCTLLPAFHPLLGRIPWDEDESDRIAALLAPLLPDPATRPWAAHPVDPTTNPARRTKA